MKIITIFLTLFCQISNAAIFGNDSRQDLNSQHLPGPAQASAILFQKDFIQISQNLNWPFRQFSLQQAYPLCRNERFLDQPVLGFCSGVLIDFDKVITAGHCIRSQQDCAHIKMTFGWSYNKSLSKTIPANEIYSCQKILGRRNTQRDGDYAIIQLDQPVQTAQPIKIAKNEPLFQDRVISLSYPLGLPLKSDQGFITRNESNLLFFETQLDTFTGSSGSGLFNIRGELVGILSSGTEDFHEDDIHRVQTSGGCLNFKRCGIGDCRNERYFKVNRIQ